MAHLVLVETKVTAGFELIGHAVQLGHEVTFIAHDLAPYLRGARVAQTPLALARAVVTGIVTTDPERLVAAVRGLDAPADAVLTLSEPHLRAVTEAAARLSVPGEDPATAALVRDKYRVRRRLAEAGVPQPGFGHAASVAEALAVAAEIGYPVVAKPVDGSGSINVGIATGPAELAELARAIVEYADYGRAVASRRTLLVEEYVPGPVVSCEVLTTGGRHELYGCTDRILSEPPWAVELGGCFPAEFADRAAAFEVCRAALDALGLRRAISHTELVLGPRGPQIIEVNGRLVGGYIPEMMSLTLDRHVYHDLIDLSLGRPVGRPRARRVACIRALTAPADGLLRDLDVSAVRRSPDAAALVLDRRPGDAVRFPRTNRDRLGFVVVVADSQPDAIARADALLDEVVITVEPLRRTDSRIGHRTVALPERCARMSPVNSLANGSTNSRTDTDTADDPHVLILAGAGGISLDYVLNSARTVTRRLSVVYLHAWATVDMSRTKAAWTSDFTGSWQDCATLEELYRAVRAIHAANPLDGITTYSELLIQPHAELAEEFGLPGNPPQAVRAAQNKVLQRTVMRDSGVLPLRFHAIRSRDDLAAAAQAVGFPAIFKPAYGAASMQVSKVNSPAELDSAYARATAAADRSPFLIKEDLYLLEELLIGDPALLAEGRADYCSVESLLQDGVVHHLAVVDKLALRGGYVEEGHLLPSTLPTDRQQEVLRHATEIITAIGLRDGAVHTEIKLTPDGPRCIEINARLGGPMGHMFAAATDHDIVASILRIAAGRPVDPAVRVERSVCFRSVPGPDRPMRVVGLADPAALRERFDCLRYLRLRFARGTVVEPGRYPHIATLLVTGQDAAECLHNVATVEQALGVVVEPADRTHVLMLDRVGYDRYRMPDGGPVLDPARYRVTLVTRPDLVGQARPGECAEVLGVDLFHAALRDGLCEAVHRDVGIDRLLVGTEQLLLPGARLRERFGVPGQTVAAVLPFRDKSVMKETAAAGGLPVCDWLTIDRADDAQPLLNKHGRIVLKPRLGSGSTGVHLVNSPADLAALADRELAGLESGEYQAEEYVDGEMLHIDATVYHGALRSCVVSRYLSTTLSHLENKPLVSVTVGDQELVADATEFTRRVIDAFGVRNSVLHLELFHLADGSLVFNEVAARNGGAGVVPAVQAITGINLYEAMVRLALDERPTESYPRTHPAAGWFLWYGRNGRLAAVEDAAVPAEWLILRRVAASVGQQVAPSGFSGTGLVTYAVGGQDEAQVRERLAFIEANSTVRYDDE